MAANNKSHIGQRPPVQHIHIRAGLPANTMTFIGHLPGDSCWKLLFQAPDNIGGLRANNRVLSVLQILALSNKYPLHGTKRFIATYTRDVEGLALYHVEESKDGATPEDLLASLNEKNLLGARTSSSDEGVGPAIWWHGTDDDILDMCPHLVRNSSSTMRFHVQEA